MEAIDFFKMSGSGNDFILIDHRQPIMPVADWPAFAAKLCRRGMAVGADGLILLEDAQQADFKWHFFNSDGSRAEMCGNGARCAARLAYLKGMARESMAFETDAGLITAVVSGDRVRIRLSTPHDMMLAVPLQLVSGLLKVDGVNTGVPHVMIEVPDIETADVRGMGRDIRMHAQFAPAGTNVNFISALEHGLWAIRTYERGVEDETLACGTGNVAAALLLAAKYRLQSPVTLKTRSGSLLKVYFKKVNDRFDAVELEGDARIVYQGRLNPEAWAY